MYLVDYDNDYASLDVTSQQPLLLTSLPIDPYSIATCNKYREQVLFGFCVDRFRFRIHMSLLVGP